MKDLTFYGCDVNLEISLLEYGLIVSNEYHEDGSGTQFCVYKMGDVYGCGHFKESEIDNLLMGNEWADGDSLAGFYSFIGIKDAMDSNYLDLNLCQKMSDLIAYYGVENICGTDYSPMGEEEVRERYLNNL